LYFCSDIVGHDGSVGITPRYGLDGPGIESRWRRDFPHPSRLGPGAHPASCTIGTRFFPGVKRPGCGVDHPPPSSTEVKERVELYLYSAPGSSSPVIRWPLPFVHALIMWLFSIMIWYDMIYDTIYDMIWYDMIWYDMIWYDMIWYDMIWYDMIWYDMIWYDMIWYDVIYI